MAAGASCSASPSEPETLAYPARPGAHRHAAVIDRVVDGEFVVFLVGPGQEEWVGILAGEPAGYEAAHRWSGGNPARAGTMIFWLVAGEDLQPGVWGVLEPPVPLPPSSAASQPHFFTSNPQRQPDGEAGATAAAYTPGIPATVLVFRPNAELTRQARDRVAARLGQLRVRGRVSRAGELAPIACCFTPNCDPAAAGEPAWPQSALEHGGWPPGPFPPTAAARHPIPF